MAEKEGFARLRAGRLGLQGAPGALPSALGSNPPLGAIPKQDPHLSVRVLFWQREKDSNPRRLRAPSAPIEIM